MPTVEINGQRVQFDRMPTTEDIDHAAEHLKAGGGASLGQVQQSMRTPEAQQARRSVLRPVAEGIGAAGGAFLGMPAGIPGMALGAVQGAGLGSGVMDVAEGRDWQRPLAQGVLTGIAMAHPYTRALSLGQRLLTSGLASTGSGALIDYLRNDQGSVGQHLAQGAADFVAGGAGQMLSEAGAQLPRPEPSEQQRFREQYAQQAGIPLSASGRTGSKPIAYGERTVGVGLGSRQMDEFYTRQMQATEQHLNQTLDQITGERPGLPKSGGQDIKTGIRQVLQARSQAYEQGQQAVARAMRPGVSSEVTPTNFVQAARSIIEEQTGSPYNTAGPARNVVALHTESAPPPPLLYDATGNAITLQSIADSDKPMPYAQARALLKQMSGRVFKGGNTLLSTVDENIPKQLRAALAQDVGDMLQANHPEAAQLYGWVQEAYGMTTDRIRERLNALNRMPDAENRLAAVFAPGKAERLDEIKEILPSDLFTKASATAVRQKYDAAVRPDGSFNSGKFAKDIGEWIKSGQLDQMAPPEVVQQLKDFVRFEPALKSTERLGYNASGTAITGASMAQLGALAQPVFRPMDPHAWGEAGLAGLTALMSPAVFSQRGSNFLASQPLSRAMTAPLRSPLVSQLSTRSLATFPEWLRAQPGDPAGSPE